MRPDGEQEPPKEPAPQRTEHRNALRKFLRVVENFFIDYIAVAFIFLVVTVVFERALETHMPAIIKFQAHLHQAVEHLNPLNLAEYLFGQFGSAVLKPIADARDGFDIAVYGLSTWAENTLQIPHVLFWLVALPLVIIAKIVGIALAFFVWSLVLITSPITLPIIVVWNGNAVEAVLVMVIFVPLWVFFGRMILFSGESVELWVRVFLWFMVSFWALVVTSLFYLLVQGAMLGSLLVVGQLLPAAPTSAATSAYVSFAIQCAGRTAEHSLTERVVDTVKSWVLSVK